MVIRWYIPLYSSKYLEHWSQTLLLFRRLSRLQLDEMRLAYNLLLHLNNMARTLQLESARPLSSPTL
jgi:hypothetical protein